MATNAMITMVNIRLVLLSSDEIKIESNNNKLLIGSLISLNQRNNLSRIFKQLSKYKIK